MSARHERQVVLAPGDWTPLDEAYARINAAAGGRIFAERDLLRDLQGGRLPSAVRAIARDGVETCGRLAPSFWDGLQLFSDWNEHVRIRGRSFRGYAAVGFFVARQPLDKFYPDGRPSAGRDTGGSPEKLPHGAKAEIRRRIARGENKIANAMQGKYPDVTGLRSWQRHVRKCRLEMEETTKPAC